MKPTKNDSVFAFTQRFSPWVFGVILGVVVKKAIDTGFAHLEFRDLCWLALTLLIIAMSFLVWLLAGRVDAFANNVKESRFHRVSIHRDVAGLQLSNAFSYCEEVVRNARESIVVVGPHFTAGIDIGTSAHSEYLENGLQECVKRHTAAEKGDLYYERIVQLDSEVFEAIKSARGGSVNGSIFADQKLAEHIRWCFQQNDRHLNFKFRVSGRQFIPSFPSVLIVDDKYLFFSLPNKTSEGPRLEYSLVMAIEDATKEIPTLFRQLAAHLANGGVEIKAVQEEADV